MEETAYFGAGCFWNSELVYSKIKGVKNTEVGFASIPNGKNLLGKAKKVDIEVVKVGFDPERVTFEELLTHFWDTHDSSHKKNLSNSYVEKSVIFWVNEEQMKTAQNSLNKKKKTNGTILTDIYPFDDYKKAPERDQKYYFKN